MQESWDELKHRIEIRPAEPITQSSRVVVTIVSGLPDDRARRPSLDDPRPCAVISKVADGCAMLVVVWDAQIKALPGR